MPPLREIERLELTSSNAAALSARLESVDAPYVIARGVEHWPAVRRWSPSYLQQKLGSIEIRYKVSSNHTHPDFGQSELGRMFAVRSSRFDAFLDMISLGPVAERARVLFTGDEQFLLRRRDGVTTINPDLAPLFDDIEVPELLPSARLYTAWAWFSAAGVRTWLHYDNNGCHNFNAQISGEKHCWLWSPRDALALAPFAFGGSNPAHNCSQIDVEQPDVARFPEFAELPRWQTTLMPGDVLFIPAWWWHTFQHLGSFNANVNFWWKPQEPRVNAVAERQALLDSAANAVLDPETRLAARTRLQALECGGAA